MARTRTASEEVSPVSNVARQMEGSDGGGEEEMKCELCGATENLQVHHLSYEPEVTQVLCMNCHQKQHPEHGIGRSLCQVEGSPIWLTIEVKKELEKLKVIPEEPYHKVVERLLKYWNETQELIKRETSGVEVRKQP